MKEKEDIGKIIARRLEQESMVADEMLWQSIEASLDKKRKKRRWFLWSILLLFVGGFGSVLTFLPSEKHTTETLTAPESHSVETSSQTIEVPITISKEELANSTANKDDKTTDNHIIAVQEQPKKENRTKRVNTTKPDTTTVVTTTYHYYNNSTGEMMNTHKKETIDSILNSEKNVLDNGKIADSVQKKKSENRP